MRGPPEMGGRTTFESLQSIQPAVMVLLSSGYNQDGQAAQLLDAGCVGFLKKPFNLEQLSEKLAEVLKTSP